MRRRIYLNLLGLACLSVIALSVLLGLLATTGRAFADLLPMVALAAAAVMLAANVIARRLTANIVKPLEQVDMQGDNLAVYDELAPYALRIAELRREIADKLSVLEARADTISAITNQMREGLLLIDAAGKVLSANHSALAILGGSADEVEQADILHVCRDIEFQKGIGESLSGRTFEIAWDRAGRFYSIFFSPVTSADEVIGAVVLFFDVTEREFAERRRREFTANVSHELKTPLTSISALSEMISSGMAAPDDIPDFAERISAQTRRLIAIIDAIIKLSEFDEGQPAGHFTELDLRELAASVIDAFQAQASNREITLRLEGDSFKVTANPQMLEELLFNLVDNAIKYNVDKGHVTVSLTEAAEATAAPAGGAAAASGYYCISVADSGIGIAPEHQSRVFERFYRVDSSRNAKTGGSGLGLAIAKHIVEHHNGYIELTSSPGQGTTVNCYLAR